MVGLEITQRLCDCFENSFINGRGEFIAHKRANAYFILHNCETELDVKCKVIEWFSRDAYKAEPYNTKKSNDKFHEFMLNGINKFLGTDFTEDEMEVIYTYLGNCCNHEKTITFIQSGYCIGVLKKK